MTCDQCSAGPLSTASRIIAQRGADSGRVTLTVCSSCVGDVLHDLSDSYAILVRRVVADPHGIQVWDVVRGVLGRK